MHLSIWLPSKWCPGIPFLSLFTVLHQRNLNNEKGGHSENRRQCHQAQGRWVGIYIERGANWNAGARANWNPWCQETLKKSRYCSPAGRIRNCKQWHNQFWVTQCLSCTWVCFLPGKNQANYNYHLKGVTDKRVKTRARAWFSLAVCLV